MDVCRDTPHADTHEMILRAGDTNTATSTQFGASGQATTVVVGQTTEQPVPAAPTAPTGPASPDPPVPPCRQS